MTPASRIAANVSLVPAAVQRLARSAGVPVVAVFLTFCALIVFTVFVIGGHVSALLPRWTQADDLGDFLGYVAAWFGLYAGLLLLRAKKLILAGLIGAWFLVLFGVGPVISVAVLTMAAYLLGDAVFLVCGFRDAALSRYPVQVAAGFACLMAMSLILVLLGAANIIVEVGLLALILGVRRRAVATAARELRSFLSADLEPDLNGWLAVIPLMLVLIYAVYASFQETHSDALIMHLLIPHQVRLTGTWSFDASLFTRFAVVPKGASWLFTLAYLLSGEIAARLINLTFTVVTSWIVYDVVKSRVDGRAALLSAGVFLSAPLTLWCVVVLFEDAVYTMYVTAAVIALTELWPAPTPRRTMLVSLFLSAAIATKAQGLPVGVPIVALLAARLLHALPLRLVVRAALMMLVPLLLVGIEPYVISLIKTGNPIFPYYNAIFRSPLYPPINFIDSRWTNHFSLSILWRMTFHTSEFMEGMNGTFGFEHLLLVPVLLLALLLEPQVAFAVPFVAAAGIGLIQLDLIQYARYIYCTFPLITIASGAIWQRLRREQLRFLMAVVLIGLTGVNVYAGRGINYFYRFWPPLPWAVDRPQPAFPAERRFNATVNDLMGRDAHVLYLARDWGAGLDGTALYNWEFDNYKLYQLGRSVTDLDGFIEFLKTYRVDFIETDDELAQSDAGRLVGYLPDVADVIQEVGSGKLWKVRPEFKTGPS